MFLSKNEFINVFLSFDLPFVLVHQSEGDVSAPNRSAPRIRLFLVQAQVAVEFVQVHVDKLKLLVCMPVVSVIQIFNSTVKPKFDF